jgi:hypothetical protein
MKRRNPEQQQSDAFVQRIRQYYPDVHELMYHVPNESRTAYHEDSGVKSGVPDFCIPIARGGFHALYIEMKSPKRRNHKDGGLSEAQAKYFPKLHAAGCRVEIAYTWQEAEAVVVEYMGYSISKYPPDLK